MHKIKHKPDSVVPLDIVLDNEIQKIILTGWIISVLKVYLFRMH